MREENRSEIIHDALNMLDDEMIEEVENLRGQIVFEKAKEDTAKNIVDIQDAAKKKRFPWRRWGTLAASVCVLIVGGWMTINDIFPRNEISEFQPNKTEDLSQGDNLEYVTPESSDLYEGPETLEELLHLYDLVTEVTEKENYTDETLYGMESSYYGGGELVALGVNIPDMQVDLEKKDGIAMDMVAFFIHEGRCYVQNEYIRTGADFVGDYVGTSKGLIDEWTEADGYVDGAGSIEGKFYEVKGVNPEFMLCMVWENGVVETYIHNNGITLITGADVVEKRLHLINNYKAVSFLTDKEWDAQYETKQQPTVLAEEQDEIFDKFLEAYADARFMFIKDSKLAKNLVYNSDAIYHLYFTTNEGIVVQFWLLGDGYVVFQGLNNVCVKIDSSVYDEVIEVLK